MNRYFLTLFILTLFVMRLQAQSSFSQPIIIGLKTGVNGSFFTNDDYFYNQINSFGDQSFNRSFRGSVIAGITVDYMIKDRLSLAGEVLWNSRGMAYSQVNNNVISVDKYGKSSSAHNYFKYKIDYIELPVTANYNVLSVSSDYWLSGYIGLAPAITINKKVAFEYPKGVIGPQKQPSDESAELTGVNSFNASLLAGFQFGAVPSFLGTFMDLRASYTLLPVFNKSGNIDEQGAKARMMTFTMGLGVKF